jgi:hypothetical protein
LIAVAPIVAAVRETLRHLDLRGAGLDAGTAQLWLSALLLPSAAVAVTTESTFLSKLEVLDLRGNAVGMDCAATVLLEAAARHPCLRSIELDDACWVIPPMRRRIAAVLEAKQTPCTTAQNL